MKAENEITVVVAMLISSVIVTALLALPATMFAMLMNMPEYISALLATNVIKTSIVASSVVGVVIYVWNIRG
jgi:ABC-type tungstate transport system substrate-binding protein